MIIYHGEAGPRQRARFTELAAQLDVPIEVVAPDDPERLAELLPHTTVWWHVLTPITDEHLRLAPNLRLIHKWGVGVNTIDLDAARSRGVAVANMPGSNAPAVAEQAALLTLAVLRRLPTHHEATAAGEGWQLDAALGEDLRELAGSTVGLVGYGDIARRFERILHGFGASTIHHTRRDDRPGWVPLDELFERADVVSLHVPLTPDTERLVDAERIASMRRGSILINTARGGLVDLDALDTALESGHLAGAGLDTFDPEPWPARPNLGRHRGVVLTPHVAWLTRETLERSLHLAAEAARAVLAGEEPANRVV